MSQVGKIRSDSETSNNHATETQNNIYNKSMPASYLIFILIAAEHRLFPTDGGSDGQQKGDCQAGVHHDVCVIFGEVRKFVSSSR